MMINYLSSEEILKNAKDCNGILTFPDTILSKDLILNYEV